MTGSAPMGQVGQPLLSPYPRALRRSRSPTHGIYQPQVHWEPIGKSFPSLLPMGSSPIRPPLLLPVVSSGLAGQHRTGRLLHLFAQDTLGEGRLLSHTPRWFELMVRRVCELGNVLSIL